MIDITINIKLFGAFRKFGESMNLSVPSGSSVVVIKTILQEKLDGDALVFDSVLANDNAILKDTDIIDCDTELSILPPVCGG